MCVCRGGGVGKCRSVCVRGGGLYGGLGVEGVGMCGDV